ncbi:hypothetical protein QAO71_17640 (plasmid) [Halopseudomonas sp. SMJS2]|uniref:hypothetical protein n=1 Tax=Halopseudomonas sp. SMJS2 TaxID=3041098 RepID=UPI00245302F4|nr:hypothetical protein [Halopseudomonas sp. SMJS2]WGK63365.1 hypothetical protein QAO71_17640 [Halopseudomonas sp. SMJS2]
MLIDFSAAHRTYLQGRSENGQWVFNRANPNNPHAWKHLASHQIFSNNALGIAIAVRNTISDSGAATAVFSGLRLSFSSKVGGSYPLMQDPGKISVTLGIEAARYLYSWLRGFQSSFRYDVTRRGKVPMSIVGFASDSHFTHTLKATTKADDGTYAHIDVGLNAGDTFTMSMFCVGFAQLLYPSFSSELVANHLLITCPVPQIAGQANPDHSLSHANDFPATGQGTSQTEMDQHGVASQEHAKAQKAIYAVGMNKWERRNLQVIEYIQQTASTEVMDQLIKAGNRGDFSGWEKLEALFTHNLG